MLSRPVVPQTDVPTAGFTIIEALVALAVVAVSIVAIGSVMASTARGTRQLEYHVALVQAAYDALWLALPPRSGPVPPELDGQTIDHNWRANFEPLQIDGPAEDVPWIPQKVTLQVLSPSGSSIHLETVRLFRRPAK